MMQSMLRSPLAQRQQKLSRRGMTLIVVLVVISIALAVSYSVLHTQSATVQLQRNTDRQSAARQAAVAGVTAALREMHVAAAWKGAESTLAGRLSSTDSYSVAFSAGDPALVSTHPEYSDFPFRVTLLSTGYAQDPASPAVTTYQVRTVARLVPKQLAAEPSGWNVPDPYTVYQWKPESDADLSRFSVEFPARIEGMVRIQRRLELCEADPDTNKVRERLMGDLHAMQQAGQGDYRPFSGELHLRRSDTRSSVRKLLTDELGVSIVDMPSSNEANWEHPGALTTYQIYPGGPSYTVPRVGPVLVNITLQPDPITNPLGIYYAPERLHIYENVTVRGTLITNGSEGDIFIYGNNVRLEAVDLPGLSGSSQSVQLPAVIVYDDLRIWPTARGSISGLVVVSDEVEFYQGPQSQVDLSIVGRLIAKELLVRGRDEWTRNSDWWTARHDEFLAQQQQPGGEPYFPVWLAQTRGLLVPPRIRIKPPTTAVTHHWKNATDPIYVPHSADSGLRWDILEWTEIP
jgi:type II secretory pathway pseudopilin PulG